MIWSEGGQNVYINVIFWIYAKKLEPYIFKCSEYMKYVIQAEHDTRTGINKWG